MGNEIPPAGVPKSPDAGKPSASRPQSDVKAKSEKPKLAGDSFGQVSENQGTQGGFPKKTEGIDKLLLKVLFELDEVPDLKPETMDKLRLILKNTSYHKITYPSSKEDVKSLVARANDIKAILEEEPELTELYTPRTEKVKDQKTGEEKEVAVVPKGTRDLFAFLGEVEKLEMLLSLSDKDFTEGLQAINKDRALKTIQENKDANKDTYPPPKRA